MSTARVTVNGKVKDCWVQFTDETTGRMLVQPMNKKMNRAKAVWVAADALIEPLPFSGPTEWLAAQK